MTGINVRLFFLLVAALAILVVAFLLAVPVLEGGG